MLIYIYYWLLNVKIRLYIIVLISLLSSPAGAAPKNISVIIDNNYPPYSFLLEDGRLSGISIDLWRLWERRTGIKVNIVGDHWANAQRRMEAGEFDVIDTMFYTKERSKKYEFSKPYAKIEVVIFFDSSLSSFNDVKSIKGMHVGVKSGDANIDYLIKNGITELREYPSYEDVVKAAKRKEIRVFVIDKPPGLFFVIKNRMEEEIRYSEPLFYGEFHRVVKKGNNELLSLIEAGFEKITNKEREEINRKWLGHSISGGKYKKYFKISLFILGGLLLLISITYFWLRMLQISVDEKTMELRVAKEKVDRFAKELLESEKRYSNLYQNIMDVIFTISLDGRFLDLNPMGISLLGIKKEDVENLSLKDILDEENYNRTLKLIKKCLVDPDSVFTFEVISKDGKRSFLEAKGAVIYKDGRPYALQGIARDITEIKKLEQQMLTSQKMESLGTLAGGIAHDFNNILMGILNYIEFMKKDYGDRDTFFTNVQHLKNLVEKAAHLVQQLLGFSRKQIILPQNLDINELIQNFSSSLLKYIGGNIRIQLYLCENRPLIYADRSQVEQMLLNIAINSRDAMPGGGDLTIRTEIVDIKDEVEDSNSYSGRFVVVSIKDTGTGIPQEILNKVFEPFFTTKPVGKGTGLGLSMVYGAMQQNRGFVRIQSKVAEGTEVRLFFPLVKEGQETGMM